MTKKTIQTITVEMVIGLKSYPDKFAESFDFINGYSKRPLPVIRVGVFQLGWYLPQDIGKRVINGQVENDEQVNRRTGLTLAQRKERGLQMIAEAKKKYKGQKNIWGLTIGIASWQTAGAMLL